MSPVSDLGLHELVVPGDSTAQKDGPTHGIDIVAIHGLNGDRIKSWEHREGKNNMWLRDLLPNRVPSARVLTFGYDSTTTSPGGAISACVLQYNARELLKELHSLRKGKENIPIVFVCHGLGGVIVKLLLWIANNEMVYLPIATRTDRLIFFGTPNFIGENPSWTDLIFNMAVVSTAPPLHQRRREILNSISDDGLTALLSVSERFFDLSKQYRILNFYETKASSFTDSVIVPEELASLGISNEENLAQEEDHVGVCTFPANGGENFNILCERIKETVDRPQLPQELYLKYVECRRKFCTLYPEVYLRNMPPLRYSRTLEWLEENSSSSTWIKTRSSAILHLHGGPGTGKTVLTHALTAILHKAVEVGPNATILSFYFDKSDDYRKSAKNLLLSFVHQLLFQGYSVYRHLRKLYDALEKRSNWTNEDLWALVREVITSQEGTPTTVIVIDALDDCEPLNIQLLENVINLKDQTDSIIKTTITSRRVPAIFERLETFHLVDLETEKCVKRDRKTFIEGRLLRLLGADFVPGEAGNLGTNFLEAELILSSLETPSHISAGIRLQLQLDLPVEQLQPSKIYESVLRNIPPQAIRWSQSVLGWLIFSACPLTIDQLTLAVAINDDVDASSLSSIQKHIFRDMESDLKRILGFLVEVREGKVFLVHHTARDFFIQQREGDDDFNFSDSAEWHARLALICLRYLSMEELQGAETFVENGPQLCMSLLPPRSREFFTYAARNWPMHCRQASSCKGLAHEILLTKSVAFLSDRQQVKRWFEPFSVLEIAFFRTGYFNPLATMVATPDESTPEDQPANWCLLLASSLGLASVVAELLRRGKYSSATRTTALEIAAEAGHQDVSAKLLDNGIVEQISSDKALEKACKKGHESVVELLLGRLIDSHPALDSDSNQIPNNNPAANGDSAAGDNDNNNLVTDTSNQRLLNSCLYLAAENGHANLVRMLLKAGSSVKDTKPSPLHIAASNGYDLVVTALLDGEASATVLDGRGMTPLHRAAENGHVAVVQVLVSRGSNVEAGDGPTKPLHLAAANGNVLVVRKLLELKADTRAADSEGRMPLHRAAMVGHIHVVKALLEHRANVAAIDKKRYTALHHASTGGHLEVVEALLAKYADPDALGEDRVRPLHLAASAGHAQIARRLLEYGAMEDPTLHETKSTPLHNAAYRGFVPVVDVLLEFGADVHRERTISPMDGWTPLHMAYGDAKMSKRLLDAGADASKADKVGRTALFISAAHGSEEATKVLLAGEANQGVKDHKGRLALDVTIKSSVRDLLSQGGSQDIIKPIVKDNDILCRKLSMPRSNFAQYVLRCRGCRTIITDDFFFHCCKCGCQNYCKTCVEKGQKCREEDHTWKIRYVGDGMVSYDELSPWVAKLKLPKDIEEVVPEVAEEVTGGADVPLGDMSRETTSIDTV